MDKQKKVRTSIEDQVFNITIDNPPLNTIDLQTLSELAAQVDEFVGDPMLKVAIIDSANPTVFITGADITQISELTARNEIQKYILKGQNIFRKIFS